MALAFNSTHRTAMNELLQQLIEGDPGIFKFGEAHLPTGNMTDPRTMDMLRQAMGQAQRGELSPRGGAGVMREVLAGPRYSTASSSAMASLVGGPGGGAPESWIDRLRNPVFKEAIGHHVEAAQELARRKDIMREMLGIMKGRWGKGGAAGLGIAALMMVLGAMHGQPDQNPA